MHSLDEFWTAYYRVKGLKPDQHVTQADIDAVKVVFSMLRHATFVAIDAHQKLAINPPRE